MKKYYVSEKLKRVLIKNIMVVTKKILNFLNNYICSISNKPHIKRLSKYSLTVNENYFRCFPRYAKITF